MLLLSLCSARFLSAVLENQQICIKNNKHPLQCKDSTPEAKIIYRFEMILKNSLKLHSTRYYTNLNI